jgi:hypothetical protein
VNGRRAKELRRRERGAREREQEEREERSRRAQAWSWVWESFEGRLAQDGEQYFFYEAPKLRLVTRGPTEEERYAFNVYEDGYLAGSTVMEICPVSVLDLVKPFRQLAADVERPFGGPWFHSLNDATREVSMMCSTYIQPGKPGRIFLALAEGIKSLGLPTYGFLANKRLASIVEKRYKPI